MAEKSDRRTPRDVLRVIFRRRRMFTLGASVFAFVALVAAPYVPVKYTGATKFERRSDAASDEAARARGESFDALKLTLQHELAGRIALERAVEELGLTRGFPRGPDGQLTLQGQMAKQELVNGLGAAVKVSWDVRSDRVDLVSVSFTHADADLASVLPNALIKNYITRVSEQIVERLTGSRDFLQKQVNECNDRLTELTGRRIEFETKHAGMLPENPGGLEERVQELTSDLETLRRQQTLATDKLERLKVLVATVEEEGAPVQVVKGPNPELKRLQDELRTREDELDAALNLRHMTEKHPGVVTLRARIADLKKRIEEAPAEVVIQTVYGSDKMGDGLAVQIATARAEVEMATREIERVQQRLAVVQDLLANFGPIRQQYLQLMKKLEEQDVELVRWQERLREVQMALAAEVAQRRTHLSAVQLAQKQHRPSFPGLWHVLGFAMFGGLAFGGGLVFLANAMDRSIVTTEDALECFDIPIHGAIGEIVTPAERVARTMRRRILSPILTLVAAAALGLAALNVVLWLQYPEAFGAWKTDPLTFLQQGVRDGVDAVKELGRSL